MILDVGEIYTVQESLKDEKIAKNLDLDVGSLNDFLDLRSTDPNPHLPNRRLDRKTLKKQDQLPKKFEQAKEEKETVKASEIISNIIKDVFKVDINEFEQMNSPEKLNKEYFQEIDPEKRKFLRMKIPLQKRQELFEQELLNVKSDLKLKLQEIRMPQQKNNLNNSQKDDNTFSRPNSQKIKQNSGSNKQFFNASHEVDSIDQNVWLQKRLERIFKVINRNAEVKRVWTEYWGNNSELRTFVEYQQCHKKPQLAQDLSSAQYAESKSGKIAKNDSDIVINVRGHSALAIKNKQLSSEHIIYLAMTQAPLINIIRAEFYRTSLSSTTFQFLSSLLGECKRLEYLNISGNHYSRQSQIKSLLLELPNLKILKMADMKIETKCFLELCEVLVQTKIQELDLSNNLLDHHAYEAVVTLIKYLPSLTQMDFSQNAILEANALPLQKKPQSYEYLEKVKLSYQRRVNIIM